VTALRINGRKLIALDKGRTSKAMVDTKLSINTMNENFAKFNV